ncbi:MBL fold metallo-hydrolase [Leptospira sp. GIMC2001]|uniref:MBL fold metallo-hydrolase n=1 Tax=Leptospira sp. GIMC2001 TaxID=1513297 RepID=UPI0004A5C2FD|nr:MBL fold metallo-hydrolase [Leptospira sp. GIMC2001]AID56171.1 metallo-beta-lactamase superfamily protein [Leptospira sp. GIMC2001]WCL51120.1 MBL fold metallo-hydrolase [Leptospira sp. GIMC2001]
MKITPAKKIPPMESIGDDIFKIVLPQPFYAPNNIYILVNDGLTLIDSGYIESIPMLQASLRTRGFSLKDIKHIIYTHNHLDHISSALLLKSYAPHAIYYGYRSMQDGVGNYIESMKLFEQATEDLFHRAFGDPEQLNDILTKSREGWNTFFSKFNKTKKGNPNLRIDVALDHNDSMEFNGRTIRFIHTPGHNLYHITPVLADCGVYFSGDLIIANLTAIYSELDGSLNDYHFTLSKLLEEPIKRLLPAHGKEIENPHKTITLVKKTLSILEKGVIRRLKEGSSDLLHLMEAAIGKKVHSGGHLPTALGLVYSIIKKMELEGKIRIEFRENGYEIFHYKEI